VDSPPFLNYGDGALNIGTYKKELIEELRGGIDHEQDDPLQAEGLLKEKLPFDISH
jgi:hypothetical protein